MNSIETILPQQQNFSLSSEKFSRSLGTKYSFYLSGELKEPEYYSEWFDTIRNSLQSDIIYIYINSPGGRLDTALQFCRVLHESCGTTIASVDGLCHSAATFIFLLAKQREISNLSSFLFHNYSGFHSGKGGELNSELIHQKKWLGNIIDLIYSKFLTKKEISALKRDQDLWMTGDQVGARLEKMVKNAK